MPSTEDDADDLKALRKDSASVATWNCKPDSVRKLLQQRKLIKRLLSMNDPSDAEARLAVA